ncbi:unnamed protein product [Caenorhabditis auriculariae]|uniref:Ground-like domain-containing protein n=1 Tax=Caenorhabditis auriculariae TaxID=2777116 RepID=A0A8S1GVK6_9PELO|nr:unnamed protein product [Caenorhabditis auriculariae]
MRLSFLLLLTFFPSDAEVVGCGQPRCGVPQSYFYQPYGYPNTPYQPQSAYYTSANTYAVAPPHILAQVDKETVLIPAKASPYEEYERELEKLKPSTVTTTITTKNEESLIAVEPPSNVTSPPVTYIRELTPYAPDPQFAGLRPMPYRPMPYLPRGCQLPAVAVSPYLRPAPYMPRGYVQPLPTAYATAPQPLPQPPRPLLPPPINDCCGRCGAPCKYRTRRNVIAALASKIFNTEYVPRRENQDEDEPKDPKCNSEQLRDIMDRYTTRTVSLSKRLIQKNAESDLGGYFSVFCSTGDFSYVARSELFCQNEKNDIICYAFKHN